MKTPQQLIAEIADRIAQLKALPEIQVAKSGDGTLCFSVGLDTFSHRSNGILCLRIYNGNGFESDSWEGLMAKIEEQKPEVKKRMEIEALKARLAELESQNQ